MVSGVESQEPQREQEHIIDEDLFQRIRKYDVLFNLSPSPKSKEFLDFFAALNGFSIEASQGRFDPINLGQILVLLHSSQNLTPNQRADVIESLTEIVTTFPQYGQKQLLTSLSDSYLEATAEAKNQAIAFMRIFFDPRAGELSRPMGCFGLKDFNEEAGDQGLSDNPQININKLHLYLKQALISEEKAIPAGERTTLPSGAFLSPEEKGLYALIPDGPIKEAAAGFLTFSKEMQGVRFDPLGLARMLSGLASMPPAKRAEMAKLFFEPLMKDESRLFPQYLKRMGYPAQPIFTATDKKGNPAEPVDTGKPKAVLFSSTYVHAPDQEKIQALKTICSSFEDLGVVHHGLDYAFGLLKPIKGGVALPEETAFSLTQFNSCVHQLIGTKEYQPGLQKVKIRYK